jgi:D-lactate dehydrogenase
VTRTDRAVNARPARYGRKLGPDPDSDSAFTIGGIVANKSSGMACGIELNTYQTLESAILVPTSGTVLDTGAPDADGRFSSLEPELYAGLVLRDPVRGSTSSVERIQHRYAIENTMGCAINSFVEHTQHIDTLLHLIVGSEGTFAFVADATFRTVPAHAHAATALLLFRDLSAATGSLPPPVEAGIASVELIDAMGLKVRPQTTAPTPNCAHLSYAPKARCLWSTRSPRMRPSRTSWRNESQEARNR